MKTKKLIKLKEEIKHDKEIIEILEKYKQLLLKQSGFKTLEEAEDKLKNLKKEIKSYK